jgi:hypothetical protein
MRWKDGSSKRRPEVASTTVAEPCSEISVSTIPSRRSRERATR